MQDHSEKSYKPPFPKPLQKTEKRSLLRLYRRARKSWIHTLYEGSYKNATSVIKLPGFRLVMPKRPEDVQKILAEDYANFPKSKQIHETLYPLLGNSIFTTNGEVWERQRRMIDPAFANAGLKKVFPLMIDAVKALQARIDSYADGSEVEIDKEMTHVTADIIMRTILSVPIENEQALEIFEWFEEFQEKASRVAILSAFKLPRWIFPRDYCLWKKRGKQIREEIGVIIKRRYEEFQEKNGETDYGDILEALMQAYDEESQSRFSEVELLDQVVVLFFAGHETSASVLSWSFYILANQKGYADAIAAEADRVYPSLDDVSFGQVHKLKCARDVFRETLRLYPPVAFFGRVAKKEGPLSKGENKKCPGAYVPFSQGPRICIGAAFAQQEALLILSTLCRDYEFMPSQSHQPDPGSRITMRSLNGIVLGVKKRTEIPDVKEEENNIPSSEDGGKCPFS